MIYCKSEIFNMNLKQVLYNDKFSSFTSGNNSAYNIGVTDLFLEGDWVYAHSRTPVEVALPWTNGGPDNYKEEDCRLSPVQRTVRRQIMPPTVQVHLWIQQSVRLCSLSYYCVYMSIFVLYKNSLRLKFANRKDLFCWENINFTFSFIPVLNLRLDTDNEA